MQRQESIGRDQVMWKWEVTGQKKGSLCSLTTDQKGMVSREIITLVSIKGDVDNFSYVLRDIKWDVYFGMKKKFFRMKS